MAKPAKSNKGTGGSPSLYSLLDSSLTRLQDPRTVAIAATLTLRLLDSLSDEWTGLVMITAVGGELTKGAIAAVKRIRGSK